MSEAMKDIFIALGYSALSAILIVLIWWIGTMAYSAWLTTKNDMLKARLSSEMEREQIKQLYQVRMQQSIHLEQERMRSILLLSAPKEESKDV